MRRGPRSPGDRLSLIHILLEGRQARRVVFQGLFVAAFALLAFVIGREAGGDAVGRTMAFGVLAFSQVLRAVNQRSDTDPVWDREGCLLYTSRTGCRRVCRWPRSPA